MAPSAEESMEIPEAATYANGEETSAFDVRSFKDAGANAPDMPVRPETSMSLDALSNPAYQAGDVKVIADAHGHETMAGGLERKAGDSPIKAEGQTLGYLPYISNLSGMDSANGFGYNPEDNDTGADRDGAVGDFAGASGSGTPAFSLLKEIGNYGNGPLPNANRAAGPEGAEGIYSRIEDAVSSLQSNAVRSIRLRLHPEGMGEMGLRLIESDSVISARITVSSPVVKDLLDADSSRLRNIFLAEGISLGKCSVELSSNLSSNDPRGFMWAWDNNGHGNASAMQARPVAGRGLENNLTGAYDSFPTGRGGIDVFV
ncbi:MAG: flagellar hook-length control protein FliK [Deltaproteobacteria bacterium]|nr:flagellar hook-length control protein FliK [Deltaproteobacteria bacterium]